MQKLAGKVEHEHCHGFSGRKWQSESGACRRNGAIGPGILHPLASLRIFMPESACCRSPALPITTQDQEPPSGSP